MPMTANMIPYQRRSGAIHCCPVSVMIGVMLTAMKKQISPPVPSTSASVLVSTRSWFSENQPRSMNSSGMNAGSRSRTRISDCFLIVPAEKLRDSVRQVALRALAAARG